MAGLTHKIEMDTSELDAALAKAKELRAVWRDITRLRAKGRATGLTIITLTGDPSLSRDQILDLLDELARFLKGGPA